MVADHARHARRVQNQTGGRETIYYVNGRFVPASQAVIPVHDLAVIRGYAVFESLRTYGGRPFRLGDHLARLKRSAELVELSFPWEQVELEKLVVETLAHNEYAEASLRIVVTGGPSEDLFTPAGNPGLVIMVLPLRAYPEEVYQQGVQVATAETERFLPEAKTIHYIAGMMAMQRARVSNPEVVEVLFVDRSGLVTEGITSNVFAFIGDRLLTPGRDILYGVTRGVVLDLAKTLYSLEIRDLPLPELLAAEEVFITGSVKEILPVRAINSCQIGLGTCGPRTRRLQAAYRALIFEPLRGAESGVDR